MQLKNMKKILSDEEKLIAAQQRLKVKQIAVDAILEKFSSGLPAEAHVRLPVVMALFGCSAASVWRHVKNGNLPAPRKFGSRITAWNVGMLRSALNA